MVDLHCTVCKGDFTCKLSWLKHLLQNDHQSLARKELLWTPYSEVNQFIVVYARSNVAENGRLLEHFSSDFPNEFVTDFVCFPERPRVRFLQFESKKKVARVLSKRIERQVKLDGRLFQFKPASECLRLEWDELLPSRETYLEANAEPSLMERFLETLEPGAWSVPIFGNTFSHLPSLQQDLDGSIFPLKSPSECLSLEGKAVLPPLESNVKAEAKDSIPDAVVTNALVNSGPDIIVPCQNLSSNPSLQRELHNIRKEIEISKKQVCFSLQILHILRGAFADADKRFTLLRNWPIRLKYPEEDIPLVFILQVDSDQRFMPMDHFKINKLLTKKRKKVSPLFKRTFSRVDKSKSEIFLEYSLYGKEDGAFLISGHTSLLARSQIWKLINYLCKFDPRCQPLIAVICYWATVNGFKFGNQIPGTKHFHVIQLPLLVLLFMCRRKLIPSPLEIRNRSKTEDAVYGIALVNIGFSEEPDFVNEWVEEKQVNIDDSERFAQEVFQLAVDFFKETGKLEEHEWVVDSETAEIFGSNDISQDYHLDGSSRMSDLKKVLAAQNSTKGRIYMTHPFHTEWFILLSDEAKIYSQMHVVGERLEKFLATSIFTENDVMKLLKV